MTLIALVLVMIALANGMEADAFVEAAGKSWGPVLFTVAALLAVLGDIKRGF